MPCRGAAENEDDQCLVEAAQWGLNRVPYRSANPLEWHVAACLQIWKCGHMSYEQHGFLQHTSPEELFVVQLCKKMEFRFFSFMESTVTVRGSGAKKVRHDPPLFCAYDQS